MREGGVIKMYDANAVTAGTATIKADGPALLGTVTDDLLINFSRKLKFHLGLSISNVDVASG